jgi:hypothetical protein
MAEAEALNIKLAKQMERGRFDKERTNLKASKPKVL